MKTYNSIPLKIIAVAVIAAAFSLSTHAQDRNWNVADGLWNVASNWAEGAVPGSYDVYINNGGTARISSGYTASNGSYSTYLGKNSGDSGYVIVDGTWNTSTARIGSLGTGEITINDGGKVTSVSVVTLGYNDGGSGKVTVNGSGIWDMTSALYVGNFGNGEFELNDTASATVGNYLYIGNEATSVGEMTMNGFSTLSVGAHLRIGYQGNGTLNLNGNSKVTVNGAYMEIGLMAGSEGNLILSDSATLTNKGPLHIGDQGTAYITIQDNATLTTSGSTTMGVNSSGVGIMTVTGSGTFNATSISVTKDGSIFTIKENGKVYATSALTLSGSTMNIQDNGFVSSIDTATLSRGAIVEVSGSKAKWQNSGQLHIGSGGTGSALFIENGGTVTSIGGFIGVLSGNEGSVTVSGASSRWDNSSTFIVSYQGTGKLFIEDGATVTNADGIVAYTAGTTGSVSISGSGSWQNSGYLIMGNLGSGTLTLSDSASVSATQFALGNDSGSAGTLNINGAAIKITEVDGSSPLEIEGGAGTGKVVFGHSGTMQFSNLMSGDNLSVEHSGIGTTTLNAVNTYAGGTVISGGIVVAGNSSAFGSGNLNINGGSLKSTVNNVNVLNLSMESGAISFADGFARTLSTQDFEMTGGSLEIDILSLSSFDTIVGSGLLALSNGTLVLNGYNGFEGTLGVSGNSYLIFDGFNPLSDYGIQITNYDTNNWIAGIDEDGRLYFTQIPEPSTLGALMGLAVLGFALLRRKTR